MDDNERKAVEASGLGLSADDMDLVMRYQEALAARGIDVVIITVTNGAVAVTSPFTDEFTELLLKRLAEGFGKEHGIVPIKRVGGS